MASIYLSIVSVCLMTTAYSMTKNEKQELRKTVKDMFQHAYNSYMTYAHPADELMPLSCKGRYRGSEPSRGDVDDVLGNFSMTLIDSLDSLAIFGEIQDFENGVKLVLDNVKFDNDIVVSVFETNIRVLGGLLGGHVTADIFKKEGIGLSWYNGELLDMAKDIGERLLPAFNTTTGIPYPRVNLRYGVADPRSRTGTESDTCTACAGTMIMEFGALSRLTGDPKFEAAGHKAMQALWTYRSRSSDLVGTVINIHNGEWVRRDSGVGAGIDSYYEYCLKAYILLGEEDYLQRFNQHYKAVMRYINRGSLFLNVHMHNPTRLSYSFMDSLQAFWPGLQVLKGDLKSAIELHEVFYSVAKRHKFLPEAFTANFEVHWGQHFLRPELVESTYFLYEATKDSYYLEVGKYIVENLNRYTRVPCGFAAVKDVRTLSHEDRMDSFLLSETLKYLYLLFTEKDDLPIDLHDFVFTTEAHILPLALSNWNGSSAQSSVYQSEHLHDHSCPSTSREGNMMSFAEEVRRKSRSKQPESCLKQDAEAISSIDSKNSRPLLRAEQFIPGNKEHLEILKSMGITVTKTQDGKVQLMQNAAVAYTSEMAAEGIKFMQSMIELAKFRNEDGAESLPRVVQILSAPYNGNIVLNAGPAQFGVDLGKSGMAVSAEVTLADPFKGCTQLNNREAADHRIVLMERGDCMFIDKVRHAESCGAVGAIIVDNNEGSSSDSQPMFAMSGDGASSGINIPAVFLFSSEGEVLQKAMQIVSRNTGGYLRVRLAEKELKQVSGTDEPTVKSEETLTSFPESDGVQENTLKTESQQTEGDTGKHTTAKAEPPPMEERMPPVYGQDALSRVSKLIEMMKGVSRQPGYEFLKELKRSKDKPAMTSSTVSDRGRWLYDVMMMKLRDGEPLESFVLRQKADEQADLNALNRRDEINKERNGIGISSSQGSVGDQVVKMRVTAGNSEYAATLGNSKDDTLYIIGEVNEDQATKSSHTSRVVSAEETTLGLDQGEDSGGDSEVIQEEVTDSEVERVTEKDGNRNEVGDERVMEEVGGRESVKNADEEARSNNEELATSELAVEIADGEARRREREEASESISCVDGAQIAGARAQGDRGRKSGIIQEDQQEMGKRVYGLGDGSVDGLEEDTESGKGIYSQEGNGSDGTREEERTIEGINEKRNEEMEEKAKGDEETNKKQQDGHESDEVTNEVSDQKNDVAEVDHGTENLDQIPREVKNFEDGLRTVASTGDSRKTADFDSDKESESLRSSYTEELESRLRGSIGENLNIVEELRTFDGKNVGELLEERRRTADPHTRDHSRTDKGAELEEGLSTTGEL